jgi:3-oxoacyl-[acyl-carrier-protein] synthase-1
LSSSEPLVIAGLGAATPVGRSAWASAAAVRAGVAGFEQHPYMVDAVGVPITVAAFPWVEDGRPFSDRLADAAVGAIREALLPLNALPSRPSLALWLNLPPDRPGMPHGLDKQIAARLHEAFQGRFSQVRVAALGHAGAMLALRAARQWLTQTPEAFCVVAGVDSYYEPDMLEWLEETEQLHGAGERNNAWGFVPGEGAGAVLIGAAPVVRRAGLAALGTLRGMGLGREDQLIGTGTVCTAQGLTQAVREALADIGREELLTDVYCDMNGEPYRADEFAFLVTRTRERFVAASEFVAPADCWGDMGAASVPLLMTLACIAGVKNYAKGDLALVWASSVGGERGAVVIHTGAHGQ